ncbi:MULTISPECIES: stage III sporulation protein AF [Virgibacillus]|uniref:Stage III sporulation protein AF n=2 Tax=Virgibacillus TaxID=84406 RepID=A0A024QB22_9BACI|nr:MULTISPECIES: stage III sporulation protein AF [Virgibacillus]EQB36000.1 hypothetical protein M948_13270 [Virgibacillus sp. CM-4]MYL41864.1 stage III sporulation protein AF [Virgibacillus massiliensis]GGJ47435.1 stage III sporulation protein AF [Virgibacillus kapii]CDQ39694.1 stage III sporulation protein AF [Virgibacillus massiliensis]
MEMLIDWVTQIILFLLLAAIIDLIIPSGSMKKYIKLVVGLILILILLKPIFFLFNIDIKSALEASIDRVEEGRIEEESMENLIESQKNEIDGTQDAYILEQMAVQLNDLAEQPLQEEFQTEIRDIQFLFANEQEMTFENLDEVIVYLRESNDGEGAVSIVDDVVINTDNPDTAKENEQNEEIKALLKDVWELEDKKLTLQWEGGAS